jgi:hypothetical protein
LIAGWIGHREDLKYCSAGNQTQALQAITLHTQNHGAVSKIDKKLYHLAQAQHNTVSSENCQSFS